MTPFQCMDYILSTSSFFSISSDLFFAMDFVLRNVPSTSATRSSSNFSRSSGVVLDKKHLPTD